MTNHWTFALWAGALLGLVLGVVLGSYWQAEYQAGDWFAPFSGAGDIAAWTQVLATVGIGIAVAVYVERSERHREDRIKLEALKSEGRMAWIASTEILTKISDDFIEARYIIDDIVHTARRLRDTRNYDPYLSSIRLVAGTNLRETLFEFGYCPSLPHFSHNTNEDICRYYRDIHRIQSIIDVAVEYIYDCFCNETYDHIAGHAEEILNQKQSSDRLFNEIGALLDGLRGEPHNYL